MHWLMWGVLIALQNAMFTWTSRARNSDNILQHAIAIPIAQTVYLGCSLFALDNGLKVIKDGDYIAGLMQLSLYVVCTSIGSLSAHYVAIRAKRKKLLKAEIAAVSKSPEGLLKFPEGVSAGDGKDA